MLDITFIMNSDMPEILSFRTCCGLLKSLDQNLEIHVRNRGDRPITVESAFDLDVDGAMKRISAVTPPGRHTIEPGELKAFYTYVDELVWRKCRGAVFYGADRTGIPVSIAH